jgi:hypothetical protein
MFDGGWTFLLNCCSQHSLFIVEILIIERIRISLYDVSNIHILLCSVLKRRVKIPWDGWHLNLFLISLRICVAKWILIIHNGFIVVNTGRSQRLEIVIYRVVGRQGVDFERSHQWLLHWSCMYNAYNWLEFVTFFWGGIGPRFKIFKNIVSL